MAAKPIKFVPANKKEIKTKVLANIRYDNVPGLPSRTAILKDLGLQGYYYFTLNAVNQQDTTKLQTVADFGKTLGVPIGMLYPVQYPDINRDFPKWLNTIITTLNPPFIGGDAETINITHGVPMTDAEYITRIKQVISHTQIPIVWDAGLIQKEEMKQGKPNETLARNLALAAVPEVKRVRQYLQLSPEPGSCIFTADQADNYRQIRIFYDVTFPDRQTKILARFGDCTIDELQWHNEDSGTKKLSTSLANYSIGEMVRCILENTEFYTTLCWMAENNLITRTNTPEPEYQSLKRVIPAFKYKYVMPIDTTLVGCKALGFSDNVNDYSMLITNNSNSEYKITAGDIKIFGKQISGVFVRDTGYARDWNSQVTDEIIADTQCAIKPNSVNFVKVPLATTTPT